jgi:hypothetical protein
MKNISLIFCNNCRNFTNHELLFSHGGDYADNIDREVPYDFEWARLETIVNLWVCRGCDRYTMEEKKIDTDAQVFYSEYYPNREKLQLFRKSYLQINPKLSQIYEETILSYNNSSPILCAIGLRALLEGVCADKGITDRYLIDAINNLKTLLPDNIVDSLHHFRFIGNEAAHQLTAPSMNHLRFAIGVMEDLLNFLYDLDYKATNLSMKAGLDTAGSSNTPNKDIIKLRFNS